MIEDAKKMLRLLGVPVIEVFQERKNVVEELNWFARLLVKLKLNVQSSLELAKLMQRQPKIWMLWLSVKFSDSSAEN